MNNANKQFLEELNALFTESSIFLFITRDTDLQAVARDQLIGVLPRIAAEKQMAKSRADENYANLLLGYESLATALISELRMWLLLKQGLPDNAWTELVNAQTNVCAARRAHERFAHLEKQIMRLDQIEHLIFPPQVFLSSGMIVQNQICSICGGEYEDCEHIKKQPYMGEFCRVRLIPSEVDHVAIVENPANKQCRILKFNDGGGNRNRMTWKLEPAGKQSEQANEGFTTEAIIAVNVSPNRKENDDIAIAD